MAGVAIVRAPQIARRAAKRLSLWLGRLQCADGKSEGSVHHTPSARSNGTTDVDAARGRAFTEQYNASVDARVGLSWMRNRQKSMLK